VRWSSPPVAAEFVPLGAWREVARLRVEVANLSLAWDTGRIAAWQRCRAALNEYWALDTQYCVLSTVDLVRPTSA